MTSPVAVSKIASFHKPDGVFQTSDLGADFDLLSACRQARSLLVKCS
jgi:hypothetical protein